jgi:hypothetical protein
VGHLFVFELGKKEKSQLDNHNPGPPSYLYSFSHVGPGALTHPERPEDNSYENLAQDDACWLWLKAWISLNIKSEATSEHSKAQNQHKTQFQHPIAQYYGACVRGSGHGNSAKPLVVVLYHCLSTWF